jgi:hypothetical protein
MNLDNQPTCLWIWNLIELYQIALIQQIAPIKTAQWNPLFPDRLAFCCSVGVIYIWDKEFGCDALQVPAGFPVINAS